MIDDRFDFKRSFKVDKSCRFLTANAITDGKKKSTLVITIIIWNQHPYTLTYEHGRDLTLYEKYNTEKIRPR